MSEHEIPLSRPDISPLEIELVNAVLRSGRLSMGPLQEQFETLAATLSGCTNGVAVSSGTAGLHLALLALGIGPGHEVITTPFSFIASANAILYVGARPVFVDICPRTLNMDPQRVADAVTDKTAAILAVEAFGNPAYMNDYASIAARHEIPLVEDCCEALGSSLAGRPCGSFGRVGVFGFYPNKQITTGEGGMIVTDDTRLAQLCRSLRNQGRQIQQPGEPASTGSWLKHERLGFNYRLNELSCALGLAQLKRFDEILQKRRRVAERYQSLLLDVPELVLPNVEAGAIQSWFVYVVRLAADYALEERNRIIEGMRRHEIGAADYFPCIHLQPFYREAFGYRPGDYPIAERVSQRTIALPFFNAMTENDQHMVAQTLKLMIARENLSR